MADGGFVKVYSSILASSVWGESLATRVVWITMLAMCDRDGVVRASSDGIARHANVSTKAADQAITVLEAPDPRSKSQEFDGRRIKRIDGGYRILNYKNYRELQTEKQKAAAERQRLFRERHRDVTVTPRDVTGTSRKRNGLSRPKAEAEAEAEAETTKTKATNTDAGASVFPSDLCNRLFEVQSGTGRMVNYPRFRKALLLLYPRAGPRFTEEQVTQAIVAFNQVARNQPADKSQFWTVEKLVGDFARWVQLGAMPLADANGITERGRLVAGTVS